MVIYFISWVMLNSIALDLQQFQPMLKVSNDDIRETFYKKQVGTIDLFKYTCMRVLNVPSWYLQGTDIFPQPNHWSETEVSGDEIWTMKPEMN